MSLGHWRPHTHQAQWGQSRAWATLWWIFTSSALVQGWSAGASWKVLENFSPEQGRKRLPDPLSQEYGTYWKQWTLSWAISASPCPALHGFLMVLEAVNVGNAIWEKQKGPIIRINILYRANTEASIKNAAGLRPGSGSESREWGWGLQQDSALRGPLTGLARPRDLSEPMYVAGAGGLVPPATQSVGCGLFPCPGEPQLCRGQAWSSSAPSQL